MGKKATLRLNKASKKRDDRKKQGGGGEPSKAGKKKRPRENDGGFHKNDVEQERFDKVIPLKKPKPLSKSDKASLVDRKGASVSKHKSELASLQAKDPEFFKFLAENDKSLLEFGDGEDDEDDIDEEEDEDMDGVMVEDDGDLEGMEFGVDEEDEEQEQDEDEDEGSGQLSRFRSSKESVGRERPNIELTAELLEETAARACDGSVSALKKLLSMYRAACMPTGSSAAKDSDSESDPDDDEDDQGKSSSSRYVIPSPELYNSVMTTVLERGATAFYVCLGEKGSGAGVANLAKLTPKQRGTPEAVAAVGASVRWSKLRLLVLSFFKSSMATLSGLAKALTGSKTDREVPVYILRSLEGFIGLLGSLPRLSRGLLKVLLVIWCEGPEPSQDAHNVRGHAFLRIRQLATSLPGSIPEECFRSSYLAYARSCKGFTEMTGSGVLYMSRCVAELFTVDPPIAYQQAFLYIRQLALHLRSAALKRGGGAGAGAGGGGSGGAKSAGKGKGAGGGGKSQSSKKGGESGSETLRQVTSWQFLNCVRLWTRVLCAQPDAETGLGALAFPLAQTILGVIAVAPSFYSLPLRFHLLSCLQILAAHCGLFIPTASKLIEVLEHPELSAKPTPSTEVLPKLPFITKLPTGSASRAPVRDLLVQEALALIRHDAEVYRFHPGFPEYAYLTIRKLRLFAKKGAGARVAKWRDMARTLASLMENYSQVAKQLRGKLGVAPCAVQGFEPLLALAGAGAGAGQRSPARLAKLLSSRGFTAISDVVIVSNGSAVGPGVGGAKTSSAVDAVQAKAKGQGQEQHKATKTTTTTALAASSKPKGKDSKRVQWAEQEDEDEDEDEGEDEDDEMDEDEDSGDSGDDAWGNDETEDRVGAIDDEFFA